MASTPATAGVGDIATQAARRRTFAIVSHPDAGKTTTTEKLLLYAGALDRAGSVKARSGQSQTTSDWMEFERRRGISITATALQFPHDGLEMTLLDTPGHHDFSEDTLRVMSAADCAVVLLDASRGIERQTARLLEVARERRMPLLVFVNKCDRPGLEPLGLLDSIEAGVGLPAAPLNWPVGESGDLRGLIERREGAFLRFERTAHGATAGSEERVPDAVAEREEGETWRRAREELELVEAVSIGFDPELFEAGEQAAVMFRLGVLELWRADAAGGDRRADPAAAAGARRRGHRASPGRALRRLRLQGAGQHGPAPPRQPRLPAHLLGPLRARHAGHECP